MWQQKVLLLSGFIVLLQIHTSSAQLRNQTLFKKGIDELDYFDAAIYSPNTTRIVGGKPVNIVQVPWQVCLYKSMHFECGGSLISADWVLTAAHCVADGGTFSVSAGSPYWNMGGQFRYVTLVVINKNYDPITMDRDIALLRVNRPFVINTFVRPVGLAKNSRSLPDKYFVSGWGTIRQDDIVRPRFLRGVTVRKVSRPNCIQRYTQFGIAITKTMICAASPGKDSCQGDSGGPLVLRGIQYGIVSFGIGCAQENYPGVYTNTRVLNKWIQIMIAEYGGKKPKFI